MTVESDTVQIAAHGPIDYVCNIGQQLAWLGAVCRLPTYGLRHCRMEFAADIDLLNVLNSSISTSTPTLPRALLQTKAESFSSTDSRTIGFTMKYEMDVFDTNDRKNPSSCWHSLIGDASIATGFPIPDRNIDDRGLQIPTEVMAALAGSSIAVNIGSGYFIKGETLAICPMRRNKNRNHVQWHLFENESQKKLSYDALTKLVGENLPPEKLEMKDLSKTTAFLGWVQEVWNCAGTRTQILRSLICDLIF